MAAIRTLLCPTDFSECAQVALPVARALARDYGAKLVLLHVRARPPAVVGEFGALPTEPGEPEEAVRTNLRRLVPADFKGPVELLVRDGDAAAEILRVAQETRCDMIVLGTHGRSGLGRLLFGSVAEAVLREAPCPVLTIKPPRSESQAMPQFPERVADKNAEPGVADTDLTTVAAVASPAEADIIRNALKNEGIGCFIEGAQQAGVVGVLGIPIKIQVRAGDAARAGKFIRGHDEHHHPRGESLANFSAERR